MTPSNEIFEGLRPHCCLCIGAEERMPYFGKVDIKLEMWSLLQKSTLHLAKPCSGSKGALQRRWYPPKRVPSGANKSDKHTVVQVEKMRFALSPEKSSRTYLTQHSRHRPSISARRAWFCGNQSEQHKFKISNLRHCEQGLKHRIHVAGVPKIL